MNGPTVPVFRAVGCNGEDAYLEEFLTFGYNVHVEAGGRKVVGINGSGGRCLHQFVGDRCAAKRLAVDVSGGSGPGDVNLTVAGLGGGNVGYGARFVEAYESAYLGFFALALVVGANYLPGVVAVGGNFSIGV